MVLLSHLYFRYGELPLVSRLFKGLGALVIGLVFNTILNLFQSGVKSVLNWIMALLGFICVFWFRMGVIKILLIAGGLNIIVAILTSRFASFQTITRPVSEFFRKSARNQDKQFVSTQIDCNEPVQRTRWFSTLEIVFWLSFILLLDIALIRLNPQVKQMGFSFLRIGSLVFGSGYAMLPFIQDVVVNKYAWLTNQQFAGALALSLVTPGPVTIIGAFIGYKVFGIVGALAGMVNMYFPAWAMTTLIATPYAKAGRIVTVKQIIGGVVAAFIGTLVVVLIRLSGSTLVDIQAITMAATAFIVQRYTKINTVWIVLCGAIISIIVF
jgi:chromate transporter